MKIRRDGSMTSRVNRDAVGRHTRWATAIFGVFLVSLVVGAAGMAFACTVSAAISMNPNRGEVGTTVTVTGQAFVPAPVEIRWDATGQVLATANGPSFSVNVRIPETGPGVYYVTAIVNGERKAAEAFKVTVPSSQTGSADEEQPGDDPARTDVTQGGGSAAGFEPERSDPSAAGPAQSPGAPSVSPTGDAISARQPTAAGALVAADRTGRGGTPGAVSRRPGVIAGPSPATDSPSLATAVTGETVGMPSPRTVGGDPWSGLDAGTVRGPSLADVAPSAGHDPAVAVGIGVLLAGAAAGLGVLALPAVRRRRVRT